MEKSDLLKVNDSVTVTIFGPDGTSLFQSTDTGFHSIEAAITHAISHAELGVPPEDCVFEVTNQASRVSHRYRINAHGHLKLIV